MEEPDVTSGQVPKRLDAEEEGRDGAHDQGFVARDAHVPKREVYRRSVRALLIVKRELNIHQTQTPSEVSMDQKTNCKPLSCVQWHPIKPLTPLYTSAAA